MRSRALRVCVVTGSRADYGLLKPLLRELQADPETELQLLVTGMHLAPEFGLSVRVIEADGFQPDARVEMLLSSDTPTGTARSLGLGVMGAADALARLEPDWVVVLGDRFEMFAAAQAALVLRLPTAHIAGGDVTLGAFDEALRHAMTKTAHLHFVTNERARRRVVQLGEVPTRVHNVGSPGLDLIRQLEPVSRDTLAERLGVAFRETNLLVTFHPVTLEPDSAAQYAELLAALADLPESFGFVFTGSNADPAGRELLAMTRAFCERLPGRAAYFTSLGEDYVRLMAHVDAVVGNSSSGLYEAPSFKIPTLNIGTRQGGRVRADSVTDVPAERAAISRGLRRALEGDYTDTVNPYGDGHAAPRIVRHLKAVEDPVSLLKKPFFDLPGVAFENYLSADETGRSESDRATEEINTTDSEIANAEEVAYDA